MTLMERILGGNHPGREEPWNRRASVTLCGERRYLTNAERAFIVAGRTVWLGGSVPMGDDVTTWEEAAWHAELHDCTEAVRAYHEEDRRNGR
jgi:hypothetical protein